MAQSHMRKESVMNRVRFVGLDGRGRGNAECNPQPRGGQKRTDSGLSRNAIRGKFFKITRVR